MFVQYRSRTRTEMNMKLFWTIAAVLLAAACTPMEWVKADADPAQMQADGQECQMRAWQEARWRALEYRALAGPLYYRDAFGRPIHMARPYDAFGIPTWKSSASRTSACAPRATSCSLRTDDPAFSGRRMRRDAVVRPRRCPRRLHGADRRIEEIRRAFRHHRRSSLASTIRRTPSGSPTLSPPTIDAAPRAAPECDRLAYRSCTTRGCRAACAPEVPDTPRAPRARDRRQQRGQMHPGGEQPRRAFVEHQRYGRDGHSLAPSLRFAEARSSR